MVVIALTNVSEILRGEIARYMLEIKAGVFIGNINLRVTDLLWEKISNTVGEGCAVLARSNNSEQGYSLRRTGTSSKEFDYCDGITLIKTLNP